MVEEAACLIDRGTDAPRHILARHVATMVGCVLTALADLSELDAWCAQAKQPASVFGRFGAITRLGRPRDAGDNALNSPELRNTLCDRIRLSRNAVAQRVVRI